MAVVCQGPKPFALGAHGNDYARIKVRGKTARSALATTGFTAAKLRVLDFVNHQKGAIAQ